ncbi:transglutaminase domain-containing protein [Pendulispora albinea]|uniref:Tetratricopeptide repeat protein n=1 Tax=Pendulispora albinea TaxID=2741071 RepID=A0ABZ2M7U2_9BACT
MHVASRAGVGAVSFGFAVFLALALGAAGCQPPKVAPPGTTVAELVADARARGLLFENPMELSPDMQQDVELAIGRRGEPRERLHKLVRHLNDRKIGFEQVQGVSLPVKRAYREHRGDCMTYAMLFVALSRHLGLETHFVHASQVLSYYESGDSLFASSHIAVGYGESPGEIVVDFSREYDDWHLASYRRIDDAAAISLYFNNVAVYTMNEGRTDRAQRMLQFLVDERPNLAELHNNLVVTYLRQAQWNEALDAAAQAMKLFPNYKPLYTNAIQAAASAGKPDLARRFELRAQEIAGSDPLYVFARGLQHYQRTEYSLAAEQFERALAGHKDSVLIGAWLVRAHLSAGHREEGLDAFVRARKLAPNDRRLQELSERFPELRGL